MATNFEVRMPEDRTPLNAPGPFYVAKDQCIACRAPEAEAPSLMAYDEEHYSCYFHRQPETPDEAYRAIRAVWASCCGAVRYGGSDLHVIKRLADIGLAGQVDAPVEPRLHRVVRDRVSFSFSGSASAAEIAAEIGQHLRVAWSDGRTSEPVVGPDSASFEWTWAPSIARAMITLVVQSEAGDESRWTLCLADPTHPAAPSVAADVDDALRASGRASDLRWYTPDEWASGRHAWASLPI